MRITIPIIANSSPPKGRRAVIAVADPTPRNVARITDPHDAQPTPMSPASIPARLIPLLF